MNINFNIAGIAQHIELCKSDQVNPANHVVIGGKNYTLKGGDKAIRFVKNCFDGLPMDSRMDLDQVSKELKSRMWLKGAKNIGLSTAHRTHQVGMSLLGKNEQIDVSAIINEVCDVFEKSYVFPEIAKKCADYLRHEMEQGAYDGISDGDAFTQAVTADLRSITEDKHIDFYVTQKTSQRPLEIQESISSTPVGEQYIIPHVLNAFDYKADTDIGWMGGSADKFPYEIRAGYLGQDHKVGYVDFRLFGVTSALNTEPQKTDSLVRRQAIIAAVQNINQAESIIVDLRNNGGGDPLTVQLLCSLFIEEGFPLNTIVYRGKKPQDYATLSYQDLPKEQRLMDSKLFVLIGPKTFSAAEEFSNNVKVLHRGTLIGEPSGGGANPGGPTLIGDGDKFELFIPTGKAINPIQEGNWEGVGIIPDYMVPADQALEEAMRHINSF